MTDAPLISVIMALYNGAAFLDQAVTSVLAQTYKNWELIIVDDGSVDESFERASYWAFRDSRIRVYHHRNRSNLGVSATRNLAVRMSRGEFLALLDCDDTWLPMRLEKQIQIISDRPDIVLIYCKAEVIDEADQLVAAQSRQRTLTRPPVFGSGTPGRVTFNDLLTRSFWIPVSSSLCARWAAAKCGGFDEFLPTQVEDDLFFSLLTDTGDAYFLDEVLVRYRVHCSQWNAKVDAKTRLNGTLAYLMVLVKRVRAPNKAVVSRMIVKSAIRAIANYAMSVNTLDLSFLAKSLLNVWSSESVDVKHKIISLLVCFRVIVGIPVRLLRRAVSMSNIFLKPRADSQQ